MLLTNKHGFEGKVCSIQLYIWLQGMSNQQKWNRQGDSRNGEIPEGLCQVMLVWSVVENNLMVESNVAIQCMSVQEISALPLSLPASLPPSLLVSPMASLMVKLRKSKLMKNLELLLLDNRGTAMFFMRA